MISSSLADLSKDIRLRDANYHTGYVCPQGFSPKPIKDPYGHVGHSRRQPYIYCIDQ